MSEPDFHLRLARALTVPNILTLSWILLLWWGESFIFRRAISQCQWHKWEDGSLASTNPYRIALIADPQLVDENTYSRRGILLTVTKFYTDLYMKRNWRLLHEILRPKLTIFLGDLMDGGREWDDVTWEKEYSRFLKVFRPSAHIDLITSLPGNHDIGFGDSVSFTALSRFKKHFGDPSSEVRAGDFNLILLDTISLSAEQKPSINRQSQQFLDSLAKDSTVPRILLTHIPLYRPRGTSCGPLRESKVPIRSGKGYQYQNILTSILSRKIIETVRPLAVFSGDDHDYCYVEHNYIGMNFPEHTIKSFSLAMGVNNPGFQLLSLSSSGEAGPSNPQFSTSPCMLPNQIHVFILYGIAALTTVALVVERNQHRIASNRSLLPKEDNDDAVDRWKPSSLRIGSTKWLTLVLESSKDIRKIGFIALGWYLWLIWY